MLTLADVRRLALALPEVVEAPHFDFTSFRIAGKIFATVPPDESHLHVFVDEAEREMRIAVNPRMYEQLRWGKKVVGLRIALAAAKRGDVKDLLRSAWERKAPKRLLRDS